MSGLPNFQIISGAIYNVKRWPSEWTDITKDYAM